jgi:hypothetical protein
MTIESFRDEESRVMKLLEEGTGKTLQEIAKAAHVSFSFISMIKKKMLDKDSEVINRLLITPNLQIIF